MSPRRAEFSRLVAVARIGFEPLRQEIAATPSEREALARRFDLLGLDRLTAAAELARTGDGQILLRAEFVADFVQSCVLTLDPVPGAVAESFSLRYGPPKSGPGETEPEDEAAFEPLVGEAIDIGEAVAQEFSLSLPQFPRGAGASIAAEAEPPGEADRPFGALSRLIGSGRDR